MKKYLAIIILFLCAACSDNDSTENLSLPQYDVDILFSPSGVGDSGYNDIMLYGIQQACNKYGFRLELHQPVTVEEGWKCYNEWEHEDSQNVKKLFIFASDDYENLLRKNPPTRQKDKDLLLLESDGELENMASFRLNMYGAAYYIGKLVSRIIPSAAVLMANPFDPIILEAEQGFKDGFLSENENLYDVFYLADMPYQGYNLPDKAYNLSFSMFMDYSFVWPLAGGSNGGVFRYTREYPNSIYTAGVDADMSFYSNKVICSLVKRLDLLLEEYITRWIDGEPLAGFTKYGFDSGFVQVKFSKNYQEVFVDLIEGLQEEAISKEKAYETNK